MQLEERPVQDQVEEATTYIKLLTQRVEEMRRRKSQALMSGSGSGSGSSSSMGGSVVEVREFGSNLEVVLISGLSKTFMLHQHRTRRKELRSSMLISPTSVTRFSIQSMLR
ncbi:UNVERIFIED_CONTAM: hypothetical protein Sradi_4783900 [Sesamum radiatum]|uniref:Uncharacterized protein n=1 Tax=Sesamum radiatum TaxID=300843 RepID=A0AAW2MWZ4_SESRA